MRASAPTLWLLYIIAARGKATLLNAQVFDRISVIFIALFIPMRARPRRHSLSQMSMFLKSSDTTINSISLSFLVFPTAWEP